MALYITLRNLALTVATASLFGGVSAQTATMSPASTVAAGTAAATPSLLSFFLLDSEPTSLEASLVAVSTPNADSNNRRPDPVTTLQVACRSNDSACRDAGIYPATVVHTQGSVWGGTTTHTVDDSTTTWVCSLGRENKGTEKASCTKTIVASATSRVESTTIEGCAVIAHRLPLVVTVGADKVPKEHFLDFATQKALGGRTIDASALESIDQSELASAGCPSTSRVMFAGGATAGTTGGAATSPTSPVGTAGTTQSTTGASSALRVAAGAAIFIPMLSCLVLSG